MKHQLNVQKDEMASIEQNPGQASSSDAAASTHRPSKVLKIVGVRTYMSTPNNKREPLNATHDEEPEEESSSDESPDERFDDE